MSEMTPRIAHIHKVRECVGPPAEGAPSFAHFAKGGNLERDTPTPLLSVLYNPGYGIATRPCQKRKDGAPAPYLTLDGAHRAIRNGAELT